MSHYFHSVTLDASLCKGCTNCIKGCPTEAIRVRDGKAHIMEERCIDCGECIRRCVNHAKRAVTDGFERLEEWPYKIALLPPSFYGLWRQNGEGSRAAALVLELGFDEVFEVAVAADIVSRATRHLIEQGKLPKPAISSACPAVIRLMQVRFPALLPNIVPIEAPVEIAAELAKRQAEKRTGLSRDKLGAFFVTPCPAKVTAIKQPVGRARSSLDGAISMSAVYGAIAKISGLAVKPLGIRASSAGVLWGTAGGEAQAVGVRSSVSVDGIHNVIRVLDEVERGRLYDIDYIEAQACVGGCLGGCLVSEDPFVGRLRLKDAAVRHASSKPVHSSEEVIAMLESGALGFQTPIEPRPVMKLDADLGRALEMMKELEKTVEMLPGLDCGACGCPNCRALAEDIVRGNAVLTDCIFLLRERVRELAEEMVVLARKVPPAMGQGSLRPNGRGGGQSDGR